MRMMKYFWGRNEVIKGHNYNTKIMALGNGQKKDCRIQRFKKTKRKTKLENIKHESDIN